MKRKPKRRQISVSEFRRAVAKLQESDLWYIPVTAGEARKLQKVFADHLCTRPPEKCRIFAQHRWFAESWNKRIRILPGMPEGLKL